MFSKLLCALVVAAPFANALSLTTPSGWTSGGAETVQWNSDPTDPNQWSLFLENMLFHNTYAIANSVNPTNGEQNVSLPIVPVDSNYQLVATDVSNVSDVIAVSGTFAIGALISTTVSGSSTIVSTVSAATSTGVNNTVPPTASTIGSSSPTGSNSLTSAGSSPSSGGSSSGSAPAASNTPLNNGAAGKVSNVVSGAALALLVAGAGFVTL